ncbi:MAG: hypothetical protein K0R17_194 [Rariglobus sp.]|jgi:hypothetical protein|nr:hypothetical protein [Rariglobus sp.]
MASSHVWKFFRIGGLDQAAVETGADLLALKHLDQKLWVALSCPVKGLELDEKTLALIDTDKDGRIRAPELLAAIDWAALHLEDLGVLLKGRDALPLAAFKTTTPEGKAVLASARHILATLGKTDAAEITLADAADTARLFASTPFNGDGIITPDSTPDAALKLIIADIIATIGGTPDRNGGTGVDQSRIDSFYADLSAFATWSEQGASPAVLTFGEGTAAALSAMQAVRAKIDDYFSRTRLAAFDSRALSALNRSEDEYLALASKDLSLTVQEVAGFPLSRIEAGKPLPLLDAVNPAWAAALATLHTAVVTPVFGAAKTALTEADWTTLKARLGAYETWTATIPGAAVAKLGLERVKALLAADQKNALTALIAQDKALDPEFTAITSVEKLLRYARDFRVLLNNFVNFFDFYSPDQLAIFQAGVLYLDSRSTEFCMQITAPNPLAAMSKAYIAYVDCKRAGEAPIKIAACFTQGDSDYLFVGRNGIFYDRKGHDWDATITSIVDNPISIHQAFWSPYKKFVRMIEEQVAKRAAAADAAANTKLTTAATLTANADKSAPPKPGEPKKIDVGTVAALGVAVGAIGGAVGAIATGLAKLTYYQIPMVIVGIILVISVPSMLIAWLKLRQRNIGPLLESNGWAINGRVKINIPFGTKLTERARLPLGARRTLADPYADEETARRKTLFVLLLILFVVAAVWIRWDHHQRGRYFWQPQPEPAPAPAATAPAPAP